MPLNVRAPGGAAARTAVIAALVFGLIPDGVLAASAPDAGRPFEPRPASEALYAIKPPEEDPARQRHIVTAVDGVEIWTETWLPAPKDGSVPPATLPTVLHYSPYLDRGRPGSSTRPEQEAAHELLVPRGYAYTTAHVRGTGASGGCADPNGAATVDDGARVIEYLGRDAPWSNGSVGMTGISRAGGTQLSVAALGDPDKIQYLKAIIPAAPVASLYDNNFQDGVPYFLAAPTATASFFVQHSLREDPGDGATPAQHLEKPGCQPELLVGSANLTGDYSAFDRERDARRAAGRITAAVLMVHGHPDIEVPALMQAGLFEKLPASTPRAGVFGVFDHEYPDSHHSQDPPVQPDWERPDWPDMVVAWYDRYLKGLDTGVETWPVAQVQGLDGQWRAEPDWPTTGGPPGHLALADGGRLTVGSGTGSTSYIEGWPENTETDTYAPGTSAVFETAPLPERLELTGQPVLDVWVSLDRPDAHLAAKLEVFGSDGVQLPQGRVIGLRSMQHLEPLVENRFEQERPIPPPVGVPVRVPLRFQPTDLVVPKGGWLKLTLAGSVIVSEGLDQIREGAGVLFSGPSQPSGSATRVTIYHDCAHPSALRFLMPHAQPDLLNVREKDEPADQPLADNRPFAPPISDAGGLATTPICGQDPIDPQSVVSETP
jgi:predicted acyl esterase